MKRLVLLIALFLPVGIASAHLANGNLTPAESTQITSLGQRRVMAQDQMTIELAKVPINWGNVLILALEILDLDDDVADIQSGAVHL